MAKKDSQRFKIVSYIFIATAFILFLSLTILFLSNIPQKFVQNNLNQYIKTNLKLNITFKSIAGNPIRNLKINKVVGYENKSTYPLIQIDTLEIKLNPIKLVLSGGNITKAIEKIYLINPVYNIVRGNNGKWKSINHSLNSNQKSTQNQLKPFTSIKLNSKAYIKNLTLNYIDKVGWSKTKIKKEFHASIENINGELSFKNSGEGKFKLKGTYKFNQKPFNIFGSININTQSFFINFSGEYLNLKHWAPYAINTTDYQVLKGFSSVTGYIKSKPTNASKKSVFWYDLNFNIKEASLNLNILSEPFEKLTGTIRLSKGILTPDILSDYTEFPKERELIIKELQNHQILSSKNKVIDIKLNKVTKKIPQIQKKILQNILRNPPLIITFKAIDSTISDIPTISNGKIDISSKKINLSIKSDKFKSKNIERLIPALKQFQIHGESKGNISISDSLLNPKLSANITSKYLYLLDQKFEEANIVTVFQNNAVTINLKTSQYHKGLVNGKVNLDLNFQNPIIDSSFYGSNIELARLINQKNNPYVTGNIQMHLKIKSKNNNLIGSINMNGNTSKIYNQEINSFFTSITVTKNKTQFHNTSIIINDSINPMSLTQKESSQNTILHLKGAQLTHFDPLSLNLSHHGLASLNILLSYPKLNLIRDLFTKKPTLDIRLEITNGTLLNTFYDKLKLNFINKESLSKIKHLSIEGNQSYLKVDGSLLDKQIQNLNLSLENVSEKDIYQSNYLNKLEQIIPKGSVSGRINISRNSPQKKQKLKINGKIEIKNGRLFSQPFDNIKTQFNWQNNALTLDNFIGNVNISKIYAAGKIDNLEVSLNIKKDSMIQMHDIIFFKEKNLGIKGPIAINGVINKNNRNLNIDLSFNSENIEHKKIRFSKSTGVLNLRNEMLDFNTTFFQSKSEKINLIGNFNINQGQSEAPDIFVKVKSKKFKIHQIENIFNFIQLLNNTKTQLQKKELQKKVTITTPYLSNESLPLYSLQKQSILNTFNMIGLDRNEKKVKSIQNTQIIDGYFNGSMTIDTKSKQFPILSSQFIVTDLQTNKIEANKLEINILEKKDSVQFKLKCKNGVIQKEKFKEIEISARLTNNNKLWINTAKFSNDMIKPLNFINGFLTIPEKNKKTEHPINLNFSLKENELSILKYIIPTIKNIKHEKSISLNISGTMEKPIFNTSHSTDQLSFEFNEEFLYANQFNIPHYSLIISNNHLNLENINLEHIQNNNNTLKKNKIDLSGKIELKDLNLINSDKLTLFTDVSTKPEEINLAITDLYKGNININNFQINGNIIIPFSKKTYEETNQLYKDANTEIPKINSTITLNNGEILIESNTNQATMPLEYDTNIIIGEKTDLITTFFGNNLFGISSSLSLEENSNPIRVFGQSNNLSYQNEIPISEGNLTLLNREFKIINFQKQQLYFSSKQINIIKNAINLETTIQDNQNIFNPKISLKSLAVIEVATPNNTFNHILMTINDNLNKFETISFDVFKSNTENPNSANELEYIGSYSISNDSLTENNPQVNTETSELIKFLMPELFSTDSTESELLNQVGETQLNYILKRNIISPLEKQLEKTTGIDDLKINYNLGKQLFETDSSSQVLGIQLIQKLFTKQLFLRLLTNIELNSEEQTEENPFELSEIELIYYVLKNKNLSINLTNYKENNNLNNYNLKTSLRYQYAY